MTVPDLEALTGWLREARLGVEHRADGLMIDDGEVQLIVGAKDSEVQIKEYWRGQERGVVFASENLLDAEKYLEVARVGQGLRLGRPFQR